MLITWIDISRYSIGTLLVFVIFNEQLVLSPLYSDIFVVLPTFSILDKLELPDGATVVSIVIVGRLGITSIVYAAGNLWGVGIFFSRQFDFTPRVWVEYPRICSSPSSLGVPWRLTIVGESGGRIIVSGMDSNTTPEVSSLMFDTFNSNGSGLVSFICTSQISSSTHRYSEIKQEYFRLPIEILNYNENVKNLFINWSIHERFAACSDHIQISLKFLD